MHNQVLVTELSCIVQVVPIFVQTHSDMPCMHVFIVFAVRETECARWQCWTDISTTNIHNLKKKPSHFHQQNPFEMPKSTFVSLELNSYLNFLPTSAHIQ